MNNPCTEEHRITTVETSLTELKDDVKSIKNYFAAFMLGHFIFFVSCVFYAGLHVNKINVNEKNIERMMNDK